MMTALTVLLWILGISAGLGVLITIFVFGFILWGLFSD